MQSLPCFLCGRKLEKRVSKNDKPYFVCDSCGIQLFIRRKQGIEKLSKLMVELKNQEIYSRASSAEYLQIIAILNEISATKAQVKKIENEAFIFLNNEQTAAKNALEEHLKELVSKLENISGHANRKG
jgi:DNA-directed RNA polymerase subunit RPC12/RpoP